MPQQIEVNYYPISIALDTGRPSAENPQANTPAVAVSSNNIVPAAGGSILKDGFLQSPNYVKNASGWKIDAAGNAEFQVITAGGYIQVFKQAGIPTSLHINDIWIDTDDSNKYYVAASVGADAIAAGEWVLTNPSAAWSTLVDDDGNKPDNNATVGAIIGTNLSGGGTADNTIDNNGVIQNLVAQHIIAPATFTAGEALTAGDTAYFKVSDGKVWKADADADESTYNFIGFVRTTAASGATDVQIITGGIITKAAWGLTAGSWYYISGTAGAVSSTPGARVLEVGIAITTTQLLIIQRKPRTKNGTSSITVNAGSSATVTITTGFKPTLANITAVLGNMMSVGYGDAQAVKNCIQVSAAGAYTVLGSYSVNFLDGSGNYLRLTIQNFTSTGFDIYGESGWGSNQTINFIYTAIG